MASKYNKLHDKTVYDFTDDVALLHEITVIDKESYLAEIKQNPAVNAQHLIELAEKTDDESLRSAVYSQFRDEIGYYKHDPADQIFWIDPIGKVGEFLFSFDRKQVFNLFADYPQKLTKEQKTLFDKENPEWAEFFKDRQ